MKTLYRYEIDYRSDDNDTQVRLKEFPVIRETEHCYFINPIYYPHKEKRVLKSAYNTYAYDTKEKAKEHFIRRTNTRIKWFEFWIEECKKGLELIKELK
jgi:hypothetical protein